MAERPQRDRGRADERAVVAEPAGHDPGARGEVDAGRAVELGLRGGEEAVAEAEGHRAGDHRQAQVEQVGHRRHRPADQRPGAARSSASASAAGRPVRAAMAVPDASASRQPCGAAGARPAVGLDDHVADVAGVAVGAVEQPAVEHDPAADAGRHDHAR